jgi:hypothetical protein
MEVGRRPNDTTWRIVVTRSVRGRPNGYLIPVWTNTFSMEPMQPSATIHTALPVTTAVISAAYIAGRPSLENAYVVNQAGTAVVAWGCGVVVV